MPQYLSKRRVTTCRVRQDQAMGARWPPRRTSRKPPGSVRQTGYSDFFLACSETYFRIPSISVFHLARSYWLPFKTVLQSRTSAA